MIDHVHTTHSSSFNVQSMGITTVQQQQQNNDDDDHDDIFLHRHHIQVPRRCVPRPATAPWHNPRPRRPPRTPVWSTGCPRQWKLPRSKSTSFLSSTPSSGRSPGCCCRRTRRPRSCCCRCCSAGRRSASAAAAAAAAAGYRGGGGGAEGAALPPPEPASRWRGATPGPIACVRSLHECILVIFARIFVCILCCKHVYMHVCVFM